MSPRKFSVSRRIALGAIGAALISPRAALAAPLCHISGHAFGTTWRLTATAEDDLDRLAGAISALFADIDRTFSPWRADSLISRFNTGAADTRHQNAALAEVTRTALSIARQSDGAFDPTVGPLVARWGFGPILGGGAPDWRGIVAYRDTLGKKRDDLTLDLCGIAKGHALDRADTLVRASGVKAFVMEVGGEFIAHGQHPHGRDWRVAVDVPPAFPVSSPVLRLPSGVAVATSGVWAQAYEDNGRTYSHIIDTLTGTPIDGAVRSVTVLSGDATTADGWATALCAAGAEAGPDLAQSNAVAALFLVERDAGLQIIEAGAIRDFRL